MINIVECMFVSCVSYICINLCCRVFCKERPDDRETLIQTKLDEVIDSYEHTSSEESLICPITQDEIELGTLIKELPCGHKFSESIDKWVSQKNLCPVCREKVIVI